MYWLTAWKNLVMSAGVARSLELQNFIAAKLKRIFFVFLRVALLVSQNTLWVCMLKQRQFYWSLIFLGGKVEIY